MDTEEALYTAISASLETAKSLEKEGKLNQALRAYSKAIRLGPGTKEAATARYAVLKLARDWEEKGKRHRALKACRKLVCRAEDCRF